MARKQRVHMPEHFIIELLEKDLVEGRKENKEITKSDPISWVHNSGNAPEVEDRENQLPLKSRIDSQSVGSEAHPPPG